MAISKNSNRVLKVTYLKIIVCPQVKGFDVKDVFFLRKENQHHKLNFCMVSFEAFNMLMQESS
jgi:hypothetical protein